MSDGEPFNYGIPSRDEAVTYLRLDGMAFGIDAGPHIEKLDATGWDRLRVLRIDGQVAAGLIVFDDGQWFGGRAVRSWGIGGVAVWPHHRRRGIGRRLMTDMLAEAHAAGTPLSVLYASTPSFYRQLGYEPAGWLADWRVDPERLPNRDAGETVQPMDGETDRDRAAAVYEKAVRAANGPMTRWCRMLWDRLLDPPDRQRLGYLIAFDGLDEGFVILDPKGDRTLEVDLGVASRRAAEAAGRLLHGLNSVVPAVRWRGGLHDPVRHLIADNAARRDRSEEWLLRIVDVEAALAGRGYPPVHAELHLDVRDGLLEANAGRYVLSLRGGTPTVQRGGSGRIELDVRALAAVYASHATPAEMRAVGLLDGPAKDLARMALAFSGPRPYMIDGF